MGVRHNIETCFSNIPSYREMDLYGTLLYESLKVKLWFLFFCQWPPRDTLDIRGHGALPGLLRGQQPPQASIIEEHGSVDGEPFGLEHVDHCIARLATM